MAEPPPAARAQAIDQAAQQREQRYQQDPQRMAHPWASGIGRVGGNVAATAPLMAMPGGAATIPGRLGMSAVAGGLAGMTQPVTGGGNFWAEKAKQGVGGAVGGAAGGALGEIVGSTLGKAIAGNTTQAIDQALTKSFRRAVKPGRAGQQNASQLGVQDHRILTAVDGIIDQKPNLKLTDEAGNTITGQLPRSLRQFSEAIDQTKKAIFQSFDQMAKAAGQQGAVVDLAPISAMLRKTAASPEVVDFHPNLAADANRLADSLDARGSYGAEEAQDVIQNLNKTLAGFFRNPTSESVTHATLLAPVSRMLREGIDQAIERLQGPGYQALRLRYGALRSVEKDVAGAVQREANKLPGGMGSVFSDLAASEEAIRGVLTLNTAALGRAATIKAAQEAMRYINNPNRAIQRLFARRESFAPSGAVRQTVGSWVAPLSVSGLASAGGAAASHITGQRRARGPHDTEPPP